MKTTEVTTTTTIEPALSASRASLSTSNNNVFENSINTQSSSSSQLLREVPISIADIDAEDVIFYAKLLGIDPFLEAHLLWIAQAGLVAPLPVGWFAVEDHRNRLYYYNWATGESSWEHPNDGHYRALVEKYRKRHLERKEEGLKKRRRKKKSGGSSRGVSPSSGAETNSATTMSGVSSSAALGNLHFFEDEDDDDEVFKDLLKPRNARAAASTTTTTTPPKTITTTKAPTPPAKEDSIESVEFDLENSHHEEEEEESIASLEAFQSGTEKASKKKKADEGEKAAPEEDKKGKKEEKEEEDSEPESDHWNSLPDNEMDPFADLFQKTTSSETSNQHQQRPMSAKVRPISAVEQQQQAQQQQQSKTEVILNNRNNNHLRKHLSILEEEDDQDQEEEEGEVEEDEDIEEVFEDDALEEVNEVEENEEEEAFGVISADKPALGSSATSTAAASSAQMSQMGRINERGSSISSSNNSEINAQINGGHLSPRVSDVNGSALPVLLLGKSSAKAQKFTFLDDEEEEEVKEVKKKSSTSAAEEGKSFQELGRRLEAEIATLKEAFRSEMTDSKKTITDLLTSFKADLGGQVVELKGKVEGDRADIRFLGERLDQLWSSLKTVERAVEESRSRFEEKEGEKKEENQEEILERLLEKALKERKRLDGESDGHFGQKVLEEKLSSVQAENGRQFSALRETLNAKVAEVKRTSMENSRMAAEELREDLLKELASGQRELRVQFQQQSREEGKRLRDALSEEMERRIGEELGRRMKKNAEEEEKRSSGVQVESILEQQLHQMEVNQRAESEQLKSRLDGLQARIDAVQEEVVVMAGKKSRRKEREVKPKQQQQQLSGPSVVVQQCRELQRALHDCALQLNERIGELRLEGDEEGDNGEDEKKSIDESSEGDGGDNVLDEKKKRSSAAVAAAAAAAAAASIRHSRSQGSLLFDDKEEDGDGGDASNDEGGDEVHQNRANAYRFKHVGGGDSNLQPVNRSLSKSTPNLCCQHCHHHQQQNQMNSTGVSPYHHHHHHHHHPRYHHQPSHLITSTAFITSTSPGQFSDKRTERKLQSIRSSSRALIEQIRSTGSSLRAELANLQSTNLSQTPKTIFSSFGSPVENLVILNSSARRLRESGGEHQPRIFFEGGNESSDERSLIRQLRSIRSTVNDRLAKMAVVIEQQKTTQI